MRGQWSLDYGISTPFPSPPPPLPPRACLRTSLIRYRLDTIVPHTYCRLLICEHFTIPFTSHQLILLLFRLRDQIYSPLPVPSPVLAPVPPSMYLLLSLYPSPSLRLLCSYLFPSQYTSLVHAPLRARGAAALPESSTLDRAPILTQICATEELRGGGMDSGNARRRGGRGRFRHYLVTTGALDDLSVADRLGRMYEEPAW